MVRRQRAQVVAATPLAQQGNQAALAADKMPDRRHGNAVGGVMLEEQESRTCERLPDIVAAARAGSEPLYTATL